MIGTCVDPPFFLLGSNSLVLWPLNLINIYALALMLILARIENIHCQFALSVWVAKG